LKLQPKLSTSAALEPACAKLEAQLGELIRGLWLVGCEESPAQSIMPDGDFAS
tara:strand:- start:235 stop:393 length:159 start_codon:yes stop_codon:yes gene_type:complete